MLLPQERTRREELEQDVQELQTLVRGLTEQNTLLRQQVAMLQTENARLHCRK